MDYRLERAETLASGLVRVIQQQTGLALEQVRDPDPLRGAHEARRRGKEIRAALRLLRRDLPVERYAAVRAPYATGARQLSQARDAEVALESLAALRRHRRLLRVEREAAERALGARLDSAREGLATGAIAVAAALFGTGAAELAATPPASDRGIERSLRALYRRGGRRMAAAVKSGAADDFHRWREDAKDLWYAVRLLAGAWEGPLDAFADELRQLGKLLGDEHDLTVLRDTLAAAGGEPPVLSPRLVRAIAARQAELRQRALAIGERVWVEKPRAFAQRMLGLWRSWATPPPTDEQPA